MVFNFLKQTLPVYFNNSSRGAQAPPTGTIFLSLQQTANTLFYHGSLQPPNGTISERNKELKD